MRIHVSDADGTPFYVQVIHQIQLLAASGRLKPGEQLPSVRKLAEQLLINPNTVARAYRELETKGVVTAKRGAGVFVSEQVSPLSNAAKSNILNERIDALLAESRQLGVSHDKLIERIHKRNESFDVGE